MRPSISVTLEPGLEQGVPWGRDLYTFVTSAAGHMMRTLQKPRKNRPSKRQVNHRRFLHNMIQRKFADIEAANHRLASALNFKEGEKNVSSLPPQKTETLYQPGSPSQGGYPQDPDRCSVHTGAGISKSRSDVSVGSYEAEISEKKPPDSGHLWKQHPKSKPAASRNNQSKGRQKRERRNLKWVDFTSMSSSKGADFYQGSELFQTEYDKDECPLISANNPTEDPQTPRQDSGFIHLGQNVDMPPSFSPGLSPLSLDPCDFSIQMFTDVSSCAQAQKTIADISESQWADIMDLFGVGSKDSEAFMDVEAYLESICACQGGAGQDATADAVGFTDQSVSFTERICSNRSEVEDLHCETGQYLYEYGFSCHEDQGLSINHFQRQNQTQINNVKPSQGTYMIPIQLPTSVSYHYGPSELQTYQEESPCMLVSCEKKQNFTPFEGVAQSFSVPLHVPEQHPISTLPHEDDWLFTDILEDRKSPDC